MINTLCLTIVAVEPTFVASISTREHMSVASRAITGNPGSVTVPWYGSSKITVFVWGKNVILKFLGNTK